MNLEQALVKATELQKAGKSPREAFAAFEGTGTSGVAILRAVCQAYGISLREARDVFDEQYQSLAAFERSGDAPKPPAVTSEARLVEIRKKN